MPKINKFDSLDRDGLLRQCIELEDELERLRPKPPRFKLGQLVACSSKAPYNWAGQPATFYVVLSVENRGGKWYYGYAKTSSQGSFHAFPEDKLRAITQMELTGIETPGIQPQASVAETGSVVPQFAGQAPGTPTYQVIPAQYPVHNAQTTAVDATAFDLDGDF